MKARSLIYLLMIASLSALNGQQPEGSLKLDASDLVFRTDTVEMNVVSASRSSKKIGELPITIYVVTRDEIRKNHYYSLIDVLKNLPGIRVSQPGTA